MLKAYRNFEGKIGSISAITCDDDYLHIGNAQGLLRVFDIKSGQLVYQNNMRGPWKSMISDGQNLFGGANGKIIVANILRGGFGFTEICCGDYVTLSSSRIVAASFTESTVSVINLDSSSGAQVSG